MKLIIILMCLVLTGCGSRGSSPGAETSNLMLQSYSYSLQASLVQDDIQVLEYSGRAPVPNTLDRIAGANVNSRAVLTIGSVDCYYNSSTSDSSMVLQDCVGGIPASRSFDIQAGESFKLHIEYGDVIVGVNLKLES